MKTSINPKLYRLTLEKMVIGVEEPILIKGIGEIVAKVDSGNSGYNVIHGEDLVVQGNIITFKTENKDGNERRVSKKIKDTINVNIGGGHIQERPVVELDVQFGGENYKKVLFSITNRKDNEHKVLLSKDFVGKELEALIDVTKDNIADDNINVDYVTEGILSAAKSVAGGVMKAADFVANGPKSGQDLLNKLTSIRKGMQGEYSPESSSKKEIDPKYNDLIGETANLAKQQSDDANLIRNHITKEPTKSIVEESLNCKVENDKEYIVVYKIIDYVGGTNGKLNADPQFQERLKKAFKAWKKYQEKDTSTTTTQKEEAEKVLHEAQQPSNVEQTPAQNQEDQEENNIDIAGTEGEKNVEDMSPEELSTFLEEFYQRNNTIFYLVAFGHDATTNNKLPLGEEITKNVNSVIQNWGLKISQGKQWDYNAFQTVANDLGPKIDSSTNARGFFAHVSGKSGARRVQFYNKGKAIFGANSKSSIDQALVDEYIQLHNIYINLGGEGEISEDGLKILEEKINNHEQSESPENKKSELIEEYNQLNSEFLQIANDMGQPSDAINIDGLQTLIELANEGSQNKQADELGQTVQGE